MSKWPLEQEDQIRHVLCPNAAENFFMKFIQGLHKVLNENWMFGYKMYSYSSDSLYFFFESNCCKQYKAKTKFINYMNAVHAGILPSVGISNVQP